MFIIKKVTQNKINKKLKKKIRKSRSKKIIGSSSRPLVIFSRSNRFLRAQAIDNVGNTLVYSSTETSEIPGEKTYSRKNKLFAQKLAEVFATKLKNKNIVTIVFDRNAFLYSNNLKIFCETLRKCGIVF